MYESEQICPYTGLRSFTEEESLYFKGREHDIELATQQLQRNKFLMLTGASGDGKSSLIYAGIIPNARAGFLKSKYTNWSVADMRPERTPFENLCKSLAQRLEIENVSSVQSELSHGFSAIIDLYKNSKRHIDTESVVWQEASDKEKAALKRNASNLLILVDQFEEFFTNPENYHRGVPSRDANLVLNLLLETARIAVEEDLPVYVVFTMRSDYIGQCAAFRGLPEFIGFSQFFVPRLNRTQLQQVIEEPAVLSGNRITRRLTERLILDLTEGVDQLPILQHALNQIWHAASNGSEEMDLLHYAMVGGMPVQELPDEQTQRFTDWFTTLPASIQACYHEPNLQNVLDTHLNKLFEQSAGYYSKKTGKTISDDDAKSVIKTSFTCLTKIDQSRAVRNRMTLEEITGIVNKPGFDAKDVGNLLDIFREPGNTFIRPFILEENPESNTLHKHNVLDITHESLIRNWEYLGQWAKEEFDNYNISVDFEQQLNRWVRSGKSSDFLLSIGQLTYFESWFNRTRPNAHWIARYLPEDAQGEDRLKVATQVLSNAKEFLSRSARRHVVTRTVMRYGAKRIGVAAAILALIVFSSFAVSDYFQKKNSSVLDGIKAQTFTLSNAQKLSPEFAVPLITEQLILENLTIPEAIAAIKDTSQKIKIATAIAAQLVMQGKREPAKEILESLTVADGLLEKISIPGNSADISRDLKLFYDYSSAVGLATFMNHIAPLQALEKRQADRSARWVLQIFKSQPAGFSDMQFLGLAFSDAINHKSFSSTQIRELLSILSPFENTNSSRSKWIEANYQQDKLLARGGYDYGIPFNGLYQDLAYLYAAEGNTEKVLQCVDTLLRYNQAFHQNDYSSYSENASNIAPVFYVYGHAAKIDSFAQGYGSRKGVTTEEFYQRMLAWAYVDGTVSSYVNFYAGGGGQSFANPNIKFLSDDAITFFYGKLKEEISRVGNADERNFKMAVALKNEGSTLAYRYLMRGQGEGAVNKLFEHAIANYKLVSRPYRDEQVSVVGVGTSDMLTRPRSFMFLFPDYRVPFHPMEPRSLIYFYSNHAFAKYILDNQLFDTLYESPGEVRYFENWFVDYHGMMCSRDWTLKQQMPASFMDMLAKKLEQRNAGQAMDMNVLYLHLGDHASQNNQPEKAIAYYNLVQPEKLLNAFQYKNFNFINSYSLEIVGNAIAHLTAYDKFDIAYRLLNVFKLEVNRSSLYGYASQILSMKQKAPAAAQRLLDSARAEMVRLENPAVFQPNRHQVAMALMYIDPDKNAEEAYKTIKNSTDKFDAMTRFSTAHALRGNLYQAMQQRPQLISPADNAFFAYTTLTGYVASMPEKKEWKQFKNDQLLFSRRYLPYVSEN